MDTAFSNSASSITRALEASDTAFSVVDSATEDSGAFFSDATPSTVSTVLSSTFSGAVSAATSTIVASSTTLPEIILVLSASSWIRLVSSALVDFLAFLDFSALGASATVASSATDSVVFSADSRDSSVDSVLSAVTSATTVSETAEVSSAGLPGIILVLSASSKIRL